MIRTETKNMVIGIDISLGETTCAVVDIRGNIIAMSKFNTCEYSDVNKYASVLCNEIMKLIDGSCGIENIRSVGISAPSGNLLTGCIENSPNLPWKGSIPLAAMLRDRLGLAVALGNDTHAVILGEYTFGCGHGMKNFGIVAIGNGLGNALFTSGKLYHGNNGFAGELGHICAVDNGRQCNCGRKGCLERYVAGPGIVLTAREVLEENDAPSLMRDLDQMTAQAIAECCDLGDELAIEVYRRTGYILGIALANYAAIVDPEALILSGGVSRAGKWLLEPTLKSFGEHVFPNIHGRVKLLISSMNHRERDILGASVMAWEVKEYSLFK